MDIYPRLNESYTRLLGLGRLEDNWDSVGAKSMDPAVISRSTNLMSYLVGLITPYQVNPLPTGRVEYRWQGSKGELIVEVTHKDRILYNLIPNTGCGMECWTSGYVETLEEVLALWVGIHLEPEKSTCSTCASKGCGTSAKRHNLPY